MSNVLKLVLGVVAVSAVALVYSALTDSPDDSGIALADSIAQAKQETREQVYKQLMPQIRAWRDSAQEFRRQRDSAKREMRQSEREFSDQMEALLATADTGRVEAPQLIALQEVHIETIEACKSALASCEAELTTANSRLSAFRDSIVPALKAEAEAQKQLANEAKSVAQPGFFARLGQNIEVFGYGVVIGGGAVLTCVLVC